MTDGRFSAEEITEAYAELHRRVQGYVDAGDWTGFPLAWQVVDVPTSRLICEVRNLMPDPGDGTHLEEPNLTIVTYAGDGLFSREEDVYNPLRFARMAVRWARIAEAYGNLGDEGRAYLDQYG